MLLKFVGRVFGLLTRFALFLAIAMLGGLGSAWVMVHAGSRLSTQTTGSWVAWPQSGRSDADPYTRAHTVRLGLLPLTSTLAMTYHARTDSDGQQLYSSCDYAIDVEQLDAAWWSLAVFDDSGRLINNSAQRYAYNTSSVMRDADGLATVVLAREAHPGNWLPTRGAGNLTVALSIQDPRWMQQSIDDPNKQKALPQIRKVNCPR